MSIKEKELEELLAKGVIDNVTAENIRNYNNLKMKESRVNQDEFLIKIVGIIGALLFGLGIILILSYNWHNIPRFIKVFMSLTPLFMIQGVMIWRMIKEKENSMWNEINNIIMYCLFGAGLAMVSRIYHISGEADKYFLIWFVAMTPLIYFARSRFVCFFNGIILFLWYFNVDVWDKIEILKLAIYSLAILPFMYKTIKEDKEITSSKIFYYSWFGILLGMILFFIEIENMVYWLFGLLLIKSVKDYLVKDIPDYVNIFGLGKFSIIVTVYLLTFRDFADEFEIEKDIFKDIKLGILLIILIIINILFRKKLDKEKIFYYLASIIVMFGLFSIDAIAACILSNIIFVSIGAIETYKGVKNKKILRLNYGFLLLGVMIITRFFDAFDSILLRGSIFIVLGIIMIILNIVFSKRVKA